MSEPKPEINVTVLRRREISTYPKIGQEVVQVLTTYVAAGLPPATVTIPKKEYTLEKEKALIKRDIQERLKIVPEAYKV